MGHRRSIEYLVIVSLFIVFGLSTLSLLVAGSQSYQKLSDNKAVQSELRLATSYMNMKVRQYDAEGMVEVLPNPLNQGPALCIHEVFDGSQYDTWVYFDRGELREATLEKGMKLANEVSFSIASIDGFDLRYDQDSHQIETTITKFNGNKPMTAKTALVLRASQGGGNRE